jgi:hypothetical protein
MNDIFKGLTVLLIVNYMAGEFILGTLLGISFKLITKFNASRSTDVRVYAASDYSSKHFGKNFPRGGGFDLFQLSPELIVVEYSGDKIVRESFYTFLGNSIKAEYQDGKLTSTASSALSAPIYLVTVVIPILFGFFTIRFPTLHKIGIPLLVSGLIWMFITIFIPMFIGLSKKPAS